MSARRTDIKSPAAKAVRLPLHDLTPRQRVEAAAILAAGAADKAEFLEFLDAAGLGLSALRAARADVAGGAS